MNKAITIGIHELVVGRRLSGPIYDPKGLLLLAAGNVITGEQKEALLARNASYVVVAETDVAQCTNRVAVENEKQIAALESDLNRRIDELVAAGRLQIRNSGPAFLERVVHHGRKRHDSAHQRRSAQQHGAFSGEIDEAVESLTAGRSANCGVFDRIADVSIQMLAADLAGTLSTAVLKTQDPSLAEHSVNVALLGMSMGIEMGLDVDNVRSIGLAGLVHDIGMSKVPAEILHAPRKLSPTEFLEVQKHAIRTANYLERVQKLPSIVPLVAYQVHERPDGSGYPRGRDMQSIHPFARILHVADAYLAMTTSRPYRRPLMPYAAVMCLLRQAQENRVDPAAVRYLLHALSLFPIGSCVALTDGSIAKVIRANGAHYTTPIVLRMTDANAQPVDVNDDQHLIDLCSSPLKVSQALPTPGSDEVPFSEDVLTLTGGSGGCLKAFDGRSPARRTAYIERSLAAAEAWR